RGVVGGPPDTSACTRPVAPCRCCGTPPPHFLGWLRATGQRSPQGTVLDGVTEIAPYCDPSTGVNAPAGQIGHHELLPRMVWSAARQRVPPSPPRQRGWRSRNMARPPFGSSLGGRHPGRARRPPDRET